MAFGIADMTELTTGIIKSGLDMEHPPGLLLMPVKG